MNNKYKEALEYILRNTRIYENYMDEYALIGKFNNCVDTLEELVNNCMLLKDGFKQDNEIVGTRFVEIPIKKVDLCWDNYEENRNDI